MKITKANGVVEYQLLAQLKQRAGETDPKITEAVTTIINGVKEGGDEAVREYTVRFDGSVPKKIEFDKDGIHAFLDQVDPAFKDAVVKAQQNIYDFHQRQAQQSWMTTKESGVIMGQRIRGLKRQQAIKLRNFIKTNDPSSFILISNTSEIIGKGFHSI